MFNKGQLSRIEHKLAQIEHSIAQIRADCVLVRPVSGEDLKPKSKTNKRLGRPTVWGKKYPQSFLDCISGRYKTKKHIAADLNVSIGTVSAYVKLARQDGVKVLTKTVTGKIKSYKIAKEQ